MYFYDKVIMVLILAVYVLLAADLFFLKRLGKMAKRIACGLPAALLLVQGLLRGMHVSMIPVYAAALLLLAFAFLGQRKIFGGFLLLLGLVLAKLPFSLVRENVSLLGYADAFHRLNILFQNAYPLKEYKKIDFDALYTAYAPLMRRAQDQKDSEAYYATLRSYIRQIPDGHVALVYAPSLAGIVDELSGRLTRENIGGDFGLTLAELDGGRVIVTGVAQGSSAQVAGLAFGDEIVYWGGMPVHQAMKQVDITWYKSNIANREHLKRAKCMLLARAAPGTQATAAYVNRQGETKEAVLTAQPDNMGLLKQNLNTFYHEDQTDGITFSILEGRYGYIRIPSMTPDRGKGLKQFRDALAQCTARKVQGLILDVRNNKGGEDEFGAALLGLLAKEELFYLREMKYDANSKTLNREKDITVKAAYAGFDRPVIVLANHQTISAGEGFVYNARKLPNVKTAGMTGTHASFLSMSFRDAVLMPEGYAVIIPSTVCAGEDNRVMIDADDAGRGGIDPDIRIPITEEAMHALYAEGKDYELEYVAGCFQ